MYTKYTEVQYEPSSYAQTISLTPYVQDLHMKAKEMVDEGKTPSIYAYMGSLPLSYRRDWISEEAALEWETFQLSALAQYNLTITTYVIGDLE